jgi:hypothetical protein
VCCSKSTYAYFELDDCAFVIVEIAVVGGGEDGDDGGKLFLTPPVVHLESVSLRLMRADDGEQGILLQEGLG